MVVNHCALCTDPPPHLKPKPVGTTLSIKIHPHIEVRVTDLGAEDPTHLCPSVPTVRSQEDQKQPVSSVPTVRIRSNRKLLRQPPRQTAALHMPCVWRGGFTKIAGTVV